MSLVINHNLMAANTARNLNIHYGHLSTSVERLSTGLRINRAADDVAGLAIRELMRADVATLNQGIRNANDAISMIQTADGALQTIDEQLIRMKELAEQAATGTYDSTQRLMIESEYQQLASEITRIAMATDFNGIKLLDGSLSGGQNIINNPIVITPIDDIIFTPATTGIAGFHNIPEALNELNRWVHNYWRLSTEANADVTGRNAMITNRYNPTIEALRSVGIFSDTIGQPALLETVDATSSLITGGTARAGQTADSVAMPTVTEAQLNLVIGDPDAPNLVALGRVNDVFYRATQGFAPEITYTPAGTPASVTLGANTINEAQSRITDLYTKATDNSGTTSLITRREAIAGYNEAIELLRGVGVFENAIGNPAKLNDTTDITSVASIAAGQAANSLARPTINQNDILDAFSTPPTEGEVIAMNNALEAIPVVGDSEPVHHEIPEHKIKIHFGTGNDSSEDYYYITMGTATASALGVGNQAWHIDEFGNKVTSAGHDISTQENAQQALDGITEAIVSKDKIRAHLGSMQNRLEATINNLAIQAENLQASESRISDTDVGMEMTNLVRNQILAQSAVAVLSQANSLPRMAMQLIGG